MFSFKDMFRIVQQANYCEILHVKKTFDEAFLSLVHSGTYGKFCDKSKVRGMVNIDFYWIHSRYF